MSAQHARGPKEHEKSGTGVPRPQQNIMLQSDFAVRWNRAAVPSDQSSAADRGPGDQLLSACMTSPNSSQVSPLKRCSWTAWIG